MEAPGCKASHEAKSSFSGSAELPPKKRTLDRGEAFFNTPPERNQSDLNPYEPPSSTLGITEETSNTDSQGKGKACPDQKPPKADLKPETTLKKNEPEPSFNVYLHSHEGGKGESSSSFPVRSSPAPRPSRLPIVCKFCGQEFSTTQALGGHQNAHKQEREMQKMMKAAQEFGANPFLRNFPGTSPRPSLYPGYFSQYPPHQGYAQRGWQPKPVYSHPRTGYSPPGFGRAIETLMRTSSTKPVGTAFHPGWPMPYTHGTRPLQRPRGATNFNPLAASNMTTFLQRMEAGRAKKQCMEPIGLNLSLKCNEHAKFDLLPKCNESSDLDSPVKHTKSTELDLNLKL